MINIRKSVFETNSSSSHSIVITKDHPDIEVDRYYYLYTNQDDMFCPMSEDLEFGRSPFNVLDTLSTKICYALASLGKDALYKIESVAVEYGVDFNHKHAIKGIRLPVVDHLVYDYSSNELVECDATEFYGDVDHQSSGLLETMLLKEDITLEEFLINPNYVVIIDGDEYDIWGIMKDAGVIDSDNISKEYGGGW